MSVWIVALGTLVSVTALPIFYDSLNSRNNIARDGVLTHKEYMQLSSREAKLLRVCQGDAVFAQGGPYAKLKSQQQTEGQPTMPKFVDPGDPPSFQETMWKKGYKCQEDDWLLYAEE
jgi:hypothetical protein